MRGERANEIEEYEKEQKQKKAQSTLSKVVAFVIGFAVVWYLMSK